MCVSAASASGIAGGGGGEWWDGLVSSRHEPRTSIPPCRVCAPWPCCLRARWLARGNRVACVDTSVPSAGPAGSTSKQLAVVWSLLSATTIPGITDSACVARALQNPKLRPLKCALPPPHPLTFVFVLLFPEPHYRWFSLNWLLFLRIVLTGFAAFLSLPPHSARRYTVNPLPPLMSLVGRQAGSLTLPKLQVSGVLGGGWAGPSVAHNLLHPPAPLPPPPNGSTHSCFAHSPVTPATRAVSCSPCFSFLLTSCLCVCVRACVRVFVGSCLFAVFVAVRWVCCTSCK